VELHEQALGPARRALEVVDAQLRRLLAALLRHVARHDSRVAAPPALAAVVGQPDAGRRDADGEPVRLAGPGRDRVQAQSAAAGLPVRPRRVIPEAAVDRPALAAVVALEQHARVAAGI